MDQPECPSRDDLGRFLRGELPGPERRRVEGHVADCDACEQSLLEIQPDTQALSRSLRQLARHPGKDPAPGLAASPRFGAALRRRALVVDPAKKLAHELQRGQTVTMGKFELLREVGSGAFGAVFRARDTELDREVAVKVQRSGDLHSEEDHELFLREARSAAQLQHPGIVSMYETGRTEDGANYLVTEFIDGSTLDVYRQQNSFTARAAARLMIAICEAVHYAHEHGVVHRDLKPANIMMDRQGRPHVMDFGLAKRDSADDSRTIQGEILGTPAYMSPEQARGDNSDVDACSDVYSLGVIFYELLTGNRPFAGNRQNLLYKVLHEEPEPPHRMADKVPLDLETICLKAMDKERSRRYPSAQEFADDLGRQLRDEAIQARPLRGVEKLARWCLRNPMATSLLATSVLGMGAGVLSVEYYTKFAVKETAAQSTQMQAHMFESINSFYSGLILDAEGKSIHLSKDYRSENEDGDPHRRSLPLPATFTLDVGERITTSPAGQELRLKVRLFSDWPWRDAAEKSAEQKADDADTLARLREPRTDDPGLIGFDEGEDPDDPGPVYISEVVEDDDGQKWLRHVQPRIMEQSCLSCHNAPHSPRQGWSVGDVRGAVEIRRPLDPPYKLKSALRWKIVMVASAAVVVMGLSTAMLAVRRRRAAL